MMTVLRQSAAAALRARRAVRAESTTTSQIGWVIVAGILLLLLFGIAKGPVSTWITGLFNQVTSWQM